VYRNETEIPDCYHLVEKLQTLLSKSLGSVSDTRELLHISKSFLARNLCCTDDAELHRPRPRQTFFTVEKIIREQEAATFRRKTVGRKWRGCLSSVCHVGEDIEFEKMIRNMCCCVARN